MASVSALQHLHNVPAERCLEWFADLARFQLAHYGFELWYEVAGVDPSKAAAIGRCIPVFAM